MISNMLLQIVFIHAVKSTWTNTHLEVTKFKNTFDWYAYSLRLKKSHEFNKHGEPKQTFQNKPCGQPNVPIHRNISYRFQNLLGY